MEVGEMVITEYYGHAGWITGFYEDRSMATVRLRRNGEIEVPSNLLPLEIEVPYKLLKLASEDFYWSQKVYFDRDVYDEDHPQRIPAEAFYSYKVGSYINAVRSDSPLDPRKLIYPLKNPDRSAFNTGGILTSKMLSEQTRNYIGKTVCEIKKFTIKEGGQIFQGQYRIYQAKRYGLDENATWPQVRKARKNDWKLMKKYHELSPSELKRYGVDDYATWPEIREALQKDLERHMPK